MSQRPLLIILSLLLLTSLTLAGCSPTTTATEQLTAPPSTAITVVDALGREVHFPEPPQRIVSMGRGNFMVCDVLFMFPEAQTRVVAMEGRGMNVSDFLPFVDSTFNDKIVLERDSGAEQVAPHNPDVVILKSYMQEKLGKQLDELGIPVVYVELETPDQFFRDVKTIGQLFGNETRAEEIMAFAQGRVDQVTAQLPEATAKPRVLMLSYSDKGGEVAFKVWPETWMQTIEVQMAGGEPVWLEAAQGGSATVVNLEQIAAWDADKIFIVTYNQDPLPIVTQLQADPKWQSLRAVKNGELYGFPADFYGWDMPDPRWILGVTWLSKTLYPENFAQVDMQQEVETFFGELYNMDEENISQNIIPQLKGSLD